jgi:CheY-like chemotaxis protein
MPEQAIWMDVDVVRISQVLTNLLSNAAKYTLRDGKIVLAAKIENHDAVIRVSDNGIGIARESLDSVFDMFAQVAHSVGISKGGLGIGLSLVRHLVMLHGGSVTAVSPGPEQGSTFVVRLPLAAASVPATAESSLEGSVPVPRPHDRLRVLVADDNVDAADTLCFLLREKGHEVRVAYDGLEAVRIGRNFRPHLAFLDIGMPCMDGHQVARALRASPETAQTRLVALTGWGAEDDRARSAAAGFDFHVLKPAAPEQVEKILATVAR